MVKIIAEAATNHGGDIVLAKEMVHAAKESGADAVKFQSWQVRTMDKAEPAYEMMSPKELSDEDHYTLMEECENTGIEFMTTCFDIKRVDFLSGLGLRSVKVASTDVGSISMLRRLRESFEHIILSTGMSTEDEVEAAAQVLKTGKFTLLHCVSLYPTPLDKAGLGRMLWLSRFSPSVGYSDHTLGNDAAKAAVAMGADIVEKHFTLKRDPDNIFSNMSALPSDIKDICDYAKEFEIMKAYGGPGMLEEEKEARRTFVGRWGDNR
ncbi:N-acetylneuraminate synthase [hydrothermal vent metagenome]|uniref:N-acetylneuraminate synthase n=1 Tax=hydrothermal vent metagenome TaxID=652676 RepID=A0A3B0QZF0_9ZZZZ